MDNRYRRVMIKISGEALKNRSTGEPFSEKRLKYLLKQLELLSETGVEFSIVIGAGNISRGSFWEAFGIPKVQADIIGMDATMVNSGVISNLLKIKLGKDRVNHMTTAGNIYNAEEYAPQKAINALEKGKVVVIGGGTGLAFYTTDTAAIQRALEVEADALLMLKNGVDGVYEEDPKTNPEARRYKTLSFDEFKSGNLKIVDGTTAALANRYQIPIHIFDFEEHGAICRAIRGEMPGTYIGNVETGFYQNN